MNLEKTIQADIVSAMKEKNELRTFILEIS